MNTMIAWLIDSATAGFVLLAAGLPLLEMMPRHGMKHRWGECLLGACILVALIVAIPGRPQLSLPLIHLVSAANPTPGTMVRHVHIGVVSDVRTGNGQAAANNFTPAASGRTSADGSGHDKLIGYLGVRTASWLGMFYFWGAVAMLLRLLFGHWTLWRLRRIGELPPMTVQRVWAELVGDKFPRQPAILVSHGITGPLTFGIFRPVVLIQPSLCRKEYSRELRSVLLHELAHIRRYDALAQVLDVIGSVVFFYQPLFWRLRHKVRLYREYMADQDAALGMASPDEYVACLLDLARTGTGMGEAASPATCLLGSHSDFYKRLQRLLEDSYQAERVTTFHSGWFVFMVLVLVAITSSVTLRAGAGQSSLGGLHADHAMMLFRQHQDIGLRRSTVVENRGIAYLLRHQGQSGEWLGRYGPAVTALVVKALVQSGYSFSDRAVRHGITFIEACRKSDGGFYSDMDPVYNTAIVVDTLAALHNPHLNQQIQQGMQFLRRVQNREAIQTHGAANAWFSRTRVHWALDGTLMIEALHDAGMSASNAAVQQALSAARQDSLDEGEMIDPHERTSEAILDNYGLLTYAQLKSMIYAGLNRRDPRVLRLVRWISNNYTLNFNPAEHNARGRYYYYMTFAKALRAYGSASITDARGIKHDWRRELYQKLAGMQQLNGSWVNHGSSDWLEGNPIMVTTYAVLTLQEINRPLK